MSHSPNPTRSRKSTSVLVGMVILALVSGGLSLMVATASAAGAGVRLVSVETLNGATTTRVIEASSGAASVVALGAGGRGIGTSGDGELLLWGKPSSAGCEIWVRELASGTDTKLLAATPMRGARLSADGQRLEWISGGGSAATVMHTLGLDENFRATGAPSSRTQPSGVSSLPSLGANHAAVVAGVSVERVSLSDGTRTRVWSGAAGTTTSILATSEKAALIASESSPTSEYSRTITHLSVNANGTVSAKIVWVEDELSEFFPRTWAVNATGAWAWGQHLEPSGEMSTGIYTLAGGNVARVAGGAGAASSDALSASESSSTTPSAPTSPTAGSAPPSAGPSSPAEPSSSAPAGAVRSLSAEASAEEIVVRWAPPADPADVNPNVSPRSYTYLITATAPVSAAGAGSVVATTRDATSAMRLRATVGGEWKVSVVARPDSGADSAAATTRVLVLRSPRIQGSSSELSVNAQNSSASLGVARAVSATLTENGAGVSGQLVSIWGKPGASGPGEWNLLGQVRTDANGRAAMGHVSPTTMRYKVGLSPTAGSSISHEHVSTVRALPRIQRISAGRARTGIAGDLGNGRLAAGVRVSILTKDATGWRQVCVATTSTGGTWKASCPVDGRKRAVELRAVSLDHPLMSSGVSAARLARR